MKNLTLTFAVAGALFFSSAAFAATNDYTHYWSFDEGTGRSANDAVGGENGVITGSSTGLGWAGGKVNVALAMDGMTGEGVALPDGFLHGSQGTISVWIKMNSLSAHNIIFSGKSTSDNSVYAALAVDKDGRPVFQFRGAASDNDRIVQATHLLNVNEWYNIVFTANSLAYHVYVNGEEATLAGDNVGRSISDITNQTFSYRIGELDAIPMNGSFDGYIDELKIYDRPLTQDEVTALYDEGNSGMPTVPSAVAPKLSFSISDDHVPLGGSVKLDWSTANVDSCVASGAWNGTVASSGEQVFTKLGGDSAYTLTCVNKYGSAASTVRVYISGGGSSTTTASSTSSGLSVVAVSSSTGSQSSSSVTTTTTSGGTTQTMTSSGTTASKAAIQALINQILALIAELQKQLAAMKATQTTTAGY